MNHNNNSNNNNNKHDEFFYSLFQQQSQQPNHQQSSQQQAAQQQQHILQQQQPQQQQQYQQQLHPQFIQPPQQSSLVDLLQSELMQLERQNAAMRNELNIYQDMSQLEYSDSDISDYGLIIADSNGDILVMNDSLCKMLKYTKQDVVRLNWRDLLFQSVDSNWVPIRQDLLNHNLLYTIEQLVLKKNPSVQSKTNAIMCKKAVKRVTLDSSTDQPLFSICKLYFE
jgi:PAS domain-containing protein